LEESAPAAPPGWYPGPDGKQRYWDGRTWLQIPPPEHAPIDTLTTEVPPTAKEGRAWSRWWVWVAVVVLALTGIGVGVNSANNARAARETAALAAQETKEKEEQDARAKAKADAAAAAEAAREAEEAQAAREAKKLKDIENALEIELREESVSGIEKSIKKMANGHDKTGFIDGPVLKVSCNPVAGGSVDDLSEKTTVFQCFVATKKNKDGSSNGYYYNATMNWTSGEYTYGYGEP